MRPNTDGHLLGLAQFFLILDVQVCNRSIISGKIQNSSGQIVLNVLCARSMRLPVDETKIPEEDMNPTVLLLLETIREQADTIQKLKDEIARLKKKPPRPKIKPSSLDKKDTDKRN